MWKPVTTQMLSLEVCIKYISFIFQRICALLNPGHKSLCCKHTPLCNKKVESEFVVQNWNDENFGELDKNVRKKFIKLYNDYIEVEKHTARNHPPNWL